MIISKTPLRCSFFGGGTDFRQYYENASSGFGCVLSTALNMHVYITVNKNAIPNDPEKPFVTSGVRIGTPCATTRGLGVAEMDRIAACIYDAATNFDAKADAIRAAVAEICAAHPLYQ